MRSCTLNAALALVGWVGTPAWAHAQDSIDLTSIQPCSASECELGLTEIARLGSMDGPGIVESDQNRVMSHPSGRGFLLFQRGAGRLKWFDETGRHVADWGVEGEGPGELNAIGHARVSPPGHTVVLDGGNGRWVTFDSAGAVVREVRGDDPLGPFQIVAGDTVWVASTSSATVKVIGGSEVREIELPLPDGVSGRTASVSIGEIAAGRSLWIGRLGFGPLERWSSQGRLEERITGPPPWLPEGTDENAPPTYLVAHAVDRARRLWTITMVPDARWRDVVGPGGRGGVGRSDYARYWDARLDIVDLETMTHLGFRTWDEPGADLFARNGKVLVSAFEYGPGMVPQMSVLGL